MHRFPTGTTRATIRTVNEAVSEADIHLPFTQPGRSAEAHPPSAISATADPDESTAVVELAARKGDGLEVVLLWSRRSGAVWVDVRHVVTGESLTIDAEPHKALDVYRHPFAYCLADAG